jgi:uncharacterized protein YcbK (DUF882 family)
MDFLKTALYFLVNLIGKKPEPVLEVSIPLDSEPKEQKKDLEGPKMGALPITAIDWTNPQYAITNHFNVSDAITLHSWSRLANETDGLNDEIKTNMVLLCNKMEQIREFLGCPINVHCIYRSPKYNTEVVKAIPNEVHSFGQAIDFDCNGHYTIDELHSKLEPVLEKYGLRMEKNTASWVHLDIHPVGNARYFNA